MGVIYLDNAATTPVLPQVAEAMTELLLREFGNPSSLHRLGLDAEKRVEKARTAISQALSCQVEEVYFTSGGTEGNNLLLKGAVQARKRQGRHVLTTPVEHPAVLDTLQALHQTGSIELELIPVDQDGIVILSELEKRLRNDTILVSVMMVNNETGSIQPIEDIARILKNRKSPCLFHVDAIQGAGKLPTDVSKMQVDLMTVSAHKLHGPKGSGAVYIRKDVQIPPLLHGGGQERGIRSGTENVPGIVGFGVAVEHARSVRDEALERVKRLKQMAWEMVKEKIPEAHLNGSLERTSPYILNMGFPGVRGEVLVHYLEADGVYVSTGSACSSRKRIVSHVLEAMGVPEPVADGSIRVSFSHLTTEQEVELFVGALTKSLSELRRLMR